MNEELLTRELLAAADDSSRRSASVVVPKLVEMLAPRSVVDFGCGRGHWLAAWRAAGVPHLRGVDSAWVPRETLVIAQDCFEAHDLRAPVQLGERFDLCTCLEVAEHVPESASHVLLDSLTRASDVILFSAAVPGQGGYGHVNEQPPEWWEQRFRARGFRPVRGFADQFAGRDDVAWWYSQNMLFYVREGAAVEQTLVRESTRAAHRRVELERVLPVVLTCAAAPDYTRSFAASYVERLGAHLGPPVLLLDLTATTRLPGPYLGCLQSLAARAIHVHPRADAMSAYDSVQDAAFSALRAAAQELTPEHEFVLFLEDDVVFSSQLVDYLAGLRADRNAGFYTLYLPGDGYGSTVVDAGRFYGTQCLLLPRASVELLLAARQHIERDFPPGYDIRWSRYLASIQRRLYASDHSYVQHIGVDSRLASASSHTSRRYRP